MEQNKIERLRELKALGYNKITNAQLMQAWKIITGKPARNTCSECFRRSSWKKLCQVNLKIEDEKKDL